MEVEQEHGALAGLRQQGVQLRQQRRLLVVLGVVQRQDAAPERRDPVAGPAAVEIAGDEAPPLCQRRQVAGEPYQPARKGRAVAT